MGDREKEFTVTVTFDAPEGKTVKSDITYNNGAQTGAVTFDENGHASVNIKVKHGSTVTFNNIPYGVMYKVTEETPADYDVSYEKDEDVIGAASTDCTITNNKEGKVDTGIVLDSMPYVLLLAVACMGLAVLMTKKRASREF